MPGNVLLVVADADLATVLAMAVRADDYRVRIAGTEDDALDALATARPDLIILDMTVPFADAALFAFHRDAPGTPRILLVPAWGEWLTPPHPGMVVLPMPFRREELRQALRTVAAG